MSGSDAAIRANGLLDAVLAEPLMLYTDEWARRLGVAKEAVEQAARSLRDDGLLSLPSAPHGMLLCPTARASP